MKSESSDVKTSNINAKKILRRIRTIKKIIERNDLTDIHLWTTFRKEFENFIENYFNVVSKMKAEKLRFLLKKRDVWVKMKRKTAFKTFMNALKKKEQTQWSSKKIKKVYFRKKFVFKKLSEFVARMIKNEAVNETSRTSNENRQSSILWSSNISNSRHQKRAIISEQSDQQQLQQSKQSKHQNEDQSKQQTKRQRQQSGRQHQQNVQFQQF